MKKELIVRKNKSQRVCFRTVFLSVIAISVIYVVVLRQHLLSLIFMPLILIFGGILFYLESWQISFSANDIQKSFFFLAVSNYSYSQIRDVYESYSHTDHGYITLSFSDGNHIVIRMKDENAVQARKLINSRHSIRHLTSRTAN